MQSSVYAPTLQRKHLTAHYFTNGTVYILGGIELDAMTNNHSLIALRLDKKDFSLHSYASAADSPNFDYPTIAGHTSHVVGDAIISVLGLPLLQDQAASPSALLTLPPSAQPFLNITHLPNPRYLHTSALVNRTLHVIGGKDTTTHKQVNDVMWSYSLASRSWTQQQPYKHSSMSGHITIVYHQWLISCFGENTNSQLISKCTWLDTISFNVTQQPLIAEWPTARKYASMISLPSNSNTHVLYGGQNDTAILNDMWFLKIDAPFSMKWTKINTLTNYRRSAHAGALIDENVILYYGGQDSPSSLAADPIYFNITNKEWIHAKNRISNPQTNLGVDLDSSSNGQNERRGISGGTIAGILTGVACVLGLGIAYFVWRRRNQRRRQNLNQSRAARFSQSPPAQHYPEKAASRSSAIHYSSSVDDDNEKNSSNIKLQGAGLKEGGSNFISLPELALYNSNRISTISLGTEFHFSAEEYRRHSHHSTASSAAAAATSSSGLQHTIPKLEFNNHSAIAKSDTSDSNKYELPTQQLQMEPLTEGKSVSYKRRGSTGFNRLTLNLFGSSNNTSATTTPPQTQQQPQDNKKNRSSSLFQLRSSRLLQPNTPTTPHMTDNRYPNLQSRVSLSAKSVSSVQWVGFNDNMDGWRDSTGSSLHLAVTNAQRSSMYHSDSSAQSTPKSPMFPHYLKDSAIQHQMFGHESSTRSSPEMSKHSSTATSENQIE
ncbi:unnamed protein product [Mucor circinelloides]